MNKEHFKKIISGYKSAPINQLYKPEMYLDLGKCTIEINILDKFHHSARSLHGSVYFKMLDDAAWGASNTYVKDVFLFTYKFSVCLKRPVSQGKIKSIGRVVDQNSKEFIAESILYDEDNMEIATGSGTFMRSKYLLKDAIGFHNEK